MVDAPFVTSVLAPRGWPGSQSLAQLGRLAAAGTDLGRSPR